MRCYESRQVFFNGPGLVTSSKIVSRMGGRQRGPAKRGLDAYLAIHLATILVQIFVTRIEGLSKHQCQYQSQLCHA